MRLLRITTTEGTFDVDVDTATAIGIDLQAYDIKEPGKRKISVSNGFTVPSTIYNMKIFGFAYDPQSTAKTIYDVCYCDYWIDNEQLIKNAKLRVEEIGERISIFLFEKADIWDLLKTYKWTQFQIDFVEWLVATYSLPDYDFPYTGTWQQFCDVLEDKDNAWKLFLPFWFGNLSLQQVFGAPEGNFYEGLGSDPTYYQYIYLSVNDASISPTRPFKTGHLATHVKTIFEFLEHKYGVNFFTSGDTFTGNIWDDPDNITQNIFIPVRDIDVNAKNLTYPAVDFYFKCAADILIDQYNGRFSPHDIKHDKAEKSMYDFVNAFFQHANIIQEQDEDGIHLTRWDTLIQFADIKDWSDKLSDKIPTFKTFIQNFKQNNYIRFKEIFEGGNKSAADYQKELICLNKNIDQEGVLFEIDAYINNFISLLGANDGIIVPDLTVSESFKTFNFFLPGEDVLVNDLYVWFKWSPRAGSPTLYYANISPVIPELYSIDSEYKLMEEVLEYPRFYEAELWLTLYDIIGLKFFRKYYFKALNGCFYLNKISGFNPEKSLQPTKVELIKVSDETPNTPYMEFWVDGIGDEWTDGLNNYYF